MSKEERILTEGQIRILLAVAASGKNGLTKQEIEKAWGCDGDNLKYLRFSKDWDGICYECESRFSLINHQDAMITGPFYNWGAVGRYLLMAPGRDYLVENNLV